MKIRFACPVCERPARVDVPGPSPWRCLGCDHLVSLAAPEASAGPLSLPACVVCGNGELYKKKAFPHWLGLSLLTVACLAFLVLNGERHPWAAWACLLGSALLDGLLYLGVGDVVVCYRCGAEHSCPSAGAAHQPFELIIAERYRQERMRRERFEADRKGM